MTDPVVVQLAYPDFRMRAVGHSQVVYISRNGDVPDDDNFVRIARAFAKTLGLELHWYQRAGLRGPMSIEVYARPGVDVAPDTPGFDHDLGTCHIVIPGICSIICLDELDEFIQRQARGQSR